MIHEYRSADFQNLSKKGTNAGAGSAGSVACLARPLLSEGPSAPLSDLAHIERIVLAHPDRVLLEVLGRAIADTLPRARMECATTAAAFRGCLFARAADLIVASVDLPGEDGFSILGALRRPSDPQRLLFVTNRSDYQLVQAMRSVGARGAIDTMTDDIACFCRALRCVSHGQTYWSPSLHGVLHGSGASARALRHLTAKEMYLFAILGDGCSDDVAAAMLNISEQTVHGYRKRLHRKLGIQHKGALVTRAFLYGLVRVTSDGVVRPGLDLLRARCLVRGAAKLALRADPARAWQTTGMPSR